MQWQERINSYLNIMYKYAGKEIDILIEHFINTAVYAVVIENRGATAIMHMEIWRKILMARDETFKIDDKMFMSASTVRVLIHEDNKSHIQTGKI